MGKEFCAVEGCKNYRMYRQNGVKSSKYCGMHAGRIQYRGEVGSPLPLPPPIKELVNTRFGKLVVIKILKRRAVNGGVYWFCSCDCGKKVEVASTALLSGKTKSCGNHPFTKTLCVRGHDMATVGRTPSGSCVLCIRARRWRNNYGLSEEDYRNLWNRQAGLCAICGKGLNDTIGQQGFGRGCRVEVDHDHSIVDKRSSVRGLLCGGRWAGCNRKLGHFNLDWLKKAVAYMENPPMKGLIDGSTT